MLPVEPRSGLPSGAPDASRAHELARHMAEAKAHFLFDQLDRHGFQQHPPPNIHELIDMLDFGPRERESLIDRLEARYPHGLGLDTLA